MSETKANDEAGAEALVRRLSEPFPPEAIKFRDGGGGRTLAYLEAHAIIRRLNAATGGRWDFAVLHEAREGDLLKATCRLTIAGLGAREHVGVQRVSARGGEDLHKGAVSDALKKCATLFGVGLELYGEDYEAAAAAEDAPAAPAAAEGPSDEALLRLVQDDLGDPERRLRAANALLARARTVAELNRRDALLAVLPEDDRRRAYRYHYQRLAQGFAPGVPASVAG